jgi:hypothetical protein
VVVHDGITAFPASEASRLPNCEAYAFQCGAQSFAAGFKDPGHCLVRALGLPVPPPEFFFTEMDLDLDATRPAPSAQPRHECMDWLDKQPVSSVLYVSGARRRQGEGQPAISSNNWWAAAVDGAAARATARRRALLHCCGVGGGWSRDARWMRPRATA